MMAKRADSTYREGVRSWDWLKVKHIIMEEAVITVLPKEGTAGNIWGSDIGRI